MTGKLSWIRRLSQIGTLLAVGLCASLVGTDEAGNRYYRARRTRPGQRERRFVIYPGETDSSSVPARWHGWLHHTLDVPLDPRESHYSWLKSHRPNLSGLPGAWLPPGHPMASGQRPASTADIQTWQPPSDTAPSASERAVSSTLQGR
ncbi:MAG: NADH:ubiquinone oxidoreductase subunit NDUFA12 [Alphaproteobacteria bacterium]|nr:MAG: NADH:ubiquinone oxidoreductase subunit NDUFA12 [Alphaproteobacteria bacterium]